MDYQTTIIKESPNAKYYRACKDKGAPNNDECFLVVLKNDIYYKFNPNYRFQIENDIVYLFQTISFDYSANGNWVYIEKKTSGSNLNVSFNYDTIPEISTSNIKDGVFHLDNNKLSRVGGLLDFKSIHDLPNTGFYYVTAPGFFYEKAIDIKQIK